VIQLRKISGIEEAQVEIIIRDSTLTWMDLTDEFIHFLQACGYTVQGIRVADYLAEQYDYQRKDEGVESVSELRRQPKKKKRRSNVKVLRKN